MSAVRFDATPSDGMTTAVIRYGTPTQSTEVEYPDAVLMRVWDDGALAVFAASGCTLEFAQPDTYWSFTWK